MLNVGFRSRNYCQNYETAHSANKQVHSVNSVWKRRRRDQKIIGGGGVWRWRAALWDGQDPDMPILFSTKRFILKFPLIFAGDSNVMLIILIWAVLIIMIGGTFLVNSSQIISYIYLMTAHTHFSIPLFRKLWI